MASRVRKSDPNPFQVKAIEELRRAKWTVDAIAAAFNVAPRTVDFLVEETKKAKVRQAVEADPE
jgi:hypothetical protein